MNIEVPTVPNTLLKHDDTLQSAVENTHLRNVETLYSFRNVAEIQQFLQEHHVLVNFLIEAHPYVSKYFGDHPQIALELISDPEIDGSEQLFAYIVTSLPVAEALERLNNFDEEWFIEQFDRVDGLFNFNLEIS